MPEVYDEMMEFARALDEKRQARNKEPVEKMLKENTTTEERMKAIGEKSFSFKVKK